MSKLHKLFLGLLVLSALLLSGCTQDDESNVPASEPAAEASAEPSAPQIIFEGTDLEGNAVSSDIFAQSKLTMVNVWATFCNPCLREMPDLGELAAEYDPKDFQLIGIVSDVPEGSDQALVESLIQQTGANYTHLLRNESLSRALLTYVSGVPTTFFIDANGTALGYVTGAREKSAWEAIIDELLEAQ